MIDIPFYYSFKEFENNYKDDLEEWLLTYSDADEVDFLNLLKSKYCYVKDSYEFYRECDNYPEKFEVNLDDFINLLINRFIELIENNIDVENLNKVFFLSSDTSDYGKGYLFTKKLLDNFSNIYDNSLGFISDDVNFYSDNEFLFLKEFVIVDYEEMTLKPNYIKHDNYYFSQIKIQKFIDEKFLNPNVDLTVNDINLNDNSVYCKNTRLTQKQCALFGRLIYDKFYKYETPKPTIKNIANTFSQIFGYSETTLHKDMKGMNYDRFTQNDIKDLKGYLKELIVELDKIE